MEIKFIKSIERDIQNWQNSVAAKSYGVEWKKFLPEDISIEDVRDSGRLKIYLEKNYYQNGEVSEFINWLENTTKPSEIQKDLTVLMDKKFINHVKIFITTFHRAPYNVRENFFYLIWRDANRKRAITNIYHELMHFLFHIYYWETCRRAGLSETQIHTLKESLTVLLNPTLEKRGLPADNGYPAHQKLRVQLKKLWSGEKNFELFLNKVLQLKIVAQ
mgnify:FL=1